MSSAAPQPSPPHLRLSPAEKNLVEAIAAAIGSLSATWLFFPLDTLKTRLQAAVPGPDGAPPPEGDSLLSVWRHLVRDDDTLDAAAMRHGIIRCIAAVVR